jgi:hypothetical protein
MSLIIWRGHSRHTGDPIIVIAKPGGNDKTNDAISFCVVHYDLAIKIAACADTMAGRHLYMELIRDRENQFVDSVCGSCEHKENKTCYAHYNFQNCGETVAMIRDALANSNIDGAWGFEHKNFLHFVFSPAKYFRLYVSGSSSALPLAVTKYIVETMVSEGGKKPLAYLEDWDDPQLQALKGSHMASVLTKAELQRAEDLGWRGFLSITGEGLSGVIPEGSTLCPGSKPFSNLIGVRLSCDGCGMCDGGAGKSVVVIRHANGDHPRNKSLVSKGIIPNEIINAKGKAVGLLMVLQ